MLGGGGAAVSIEVSRGCEPQPSSATAGRSGSELGSEVKTGAGEGAGRKPKSSTALPPNAAAQREMKAIKAVRHRTWVYSRVGDACGRSWKAVV